MRKHPLLTKINLRWVSLQERDFKGMEAEMSTVTTRALMKSVGGL